MNDRFKRQGFLGVEGQRAIERVRVAICGLGGGGAYLVTQLAHLGVMDYALFDSDIAKLWNLNRTITLTEADIAEGVLKIDAAERRILQVRSTARIEKYACRWQDRPDALCGRDIAFGSVDGFKEREELEATCRRYLMPLIDLGMDVRTLEGHRPRMFGQVILSMPGEACMKCMGFLNDRNLALEAQKYGDAGDNPQVVWRSVTWRPQPSACLQICSPIGPACSVSGFI